MQIQHSTFVIHELSAPSCFCYMKRFITVIYRWLVLHFESDKTISFIAFINQILDISISSDRFKGKYDIGACEFSYQMKLIKYDFVTEIRVISLFLYMSVIQYEIWPRIFCDFAY